MIIITFRTLQIEGHNSEARTKELNMNYPRSYSTLFETKANISGNFGLLEADFQIILARGPCVLAKI